MGGGGTRPRYTLFNGDLRGRGSQDIPEFQDTGPPLERKQYFSEFRGHRFSNSGKSSNGGGRESMNLGAQYLQTFRGIPLMEVDRNNQNGKPQTCCRVILGFFPLFCPSLG